MVWRVILACHVNLFDSRVYNAYIPNHLIVFRINYIPWYMCTNSENFARILLLCWKNYSIVYSIYRRDRLIKIIYSQVKFAPALLYWKKISLCNFLMIKWTTFLRPFCYFLIPITTPRFCNSLWTFFLINIFFPIERFYIFEF